MCWTFYPLTSQFSRILALSDRRVTHHTWRKEVSALFCIYELIDIQDCLAFLVFLDRTQRERSSSHQVSTGFLGYLVMDPWVIVKT